MDRKRNIIKIIIVILCLCGVMMFALVAAGVNLPYINSFRNGLKHTVGQFCNVVGIELPTDVRLYLKDTAPPEPRPTMIPAAELDELEKALDYQTEEEGEAPPEGSAVLTTLKPVKTSRGGNQPTALDGASNSRFAEYKSDILCVNETRYRAFNQKGELLWEIPIQMQDPQLIVKGSYVLINEIGAKKIMLFKGKKMIFSKSTEGNIISADLSKNGDVVAVTEKGYFKGQVVVFNNNGKVIFAWDSGSYNILDAAISEDRRVAVSFLKTDVGADGFVTCFNVDGEEIFKTYDFSNAIIFDLVYSGKNLCGISESRCIGFSPKGKTVWEHWFNDNVLTDYSISKDGDMLFLFENAGTGELKVITANGKQYEPIKTESMPKVITVEHDRIAYNSGRDAVTCNFKGKNVRRTSCDADIKDMYVLERDKMFCVYSSSIQTRSTEKDKKPEKIFVPETTTGE